MLFRSNASSAPKRPAGETTAGTTAAGKENQSGRDGASASDQRTELDRLQEEYARQLRQAGELLTQFQRGQGPGVGGTPQMPEDWQNGDGKTGKVPLAGTPRKLFSKQLRSLRWKVFMII